MTPYALPFILFIFAGCETFHGISAKDDQFPILSEKSCIEKAIRTVNNVEFDSYEKTNRIAKTMADTDIKIHSDIFRYKIPKLDPTIARGLVLITESKSEDPREDFNSIEYDNSYGRLNGAKYTHDETLMAQEAVENINSSIKTLCSLSTFRAPIKN